MPNYAQHLNQELTHWAVSGSDGFGGFTYAAPIVLEGRWEDKNELFISFDQEQVVSRAIVYLDADIDDGDFLALDDQTATADPGTLDTAFRVRMTGSVVDLRNTQTLYKAWL
jgi:hypothetical protein